MNAIESYYTVARVCALLDVSRDWLDVRIRSGLLGQVVDLNAEGPKPDIRIPASGLNNFLSSHEYRPPADHPVAARNLGELRRKAHARARAHGRFAQASEKLTL